MLICELCGREVDGTTKHHLIPKHKKTDGRTTDVCRPCHKQIHAMFTNNELKRNFDTLEKLKADSKIKKFVIWVQKKNPGRVRTKQSRR